MFFLQCCLETPPLSRLATLLCPTRRQKFPVTRALVGGRVPPPVTVQFEIMIQDDATQAPPEAADHPVPQEEDVDAELEALAQEEDVDAELQAPAQARQLH